MINCIERNINVLSDLNCVAQPIEYVQYTNAISILFHLVDYTIPEGSAARVYVEWPSTKGEYDNAVIEQNSIRVKVKDTMFSEVGKCFLQLCIVNGEDTLVTFKYPVVVKENKVPGITEPSKNQSDFLDEYLSEIDNKIEITTQQVKDTAQAKEEALTYAGNSERSAKNAAQSENNALQHSKDSLASANAAKGSEDKSLEYSNAAATSADNAEKSNVASKQNADNSASSAAQSAQSEENARVYAESAKADAEQINGRIDLAVESAESAEQSAENAAAKSAVADEKANLAEQYALMAESFTHGGTGIRGNEAVDNAQYFLEQAKQISQSMNGLVPIGTIAFEDLSLEENQVNKYMFNISNDFVTDDTFKEGAGRSYPAGVNVFRTNDGYWDCLAGSFQTPNGDTKDNTIAFVPASTRANIQSGEKHSVIFGKIAKWFADLKTVAFTGSYNDLSDKPSADDVGAVATGGDVAENTVSYTEVETLTELVSGEKLKVSFGKLKQTVKNVISILKLLGNKDISKIGDGTVTGILSALNTDLTTCKVEYNQFNSVIEYVNYIPVGTETYFASWSPKTEYPLQVKGRWKCKIYKPFEEITYTRIELSVFVNGAVHYEWIGTVKEDSTIVWEQIVTNNNLKWTTLTLPEPTYNSDENSYSCNIDLSKYTEIEIRLWVVNYAGSIDVRVVSLDSTGNEYHALFYDGTHFNFCKVVINYSFIKVINITSNMPTQNVIQVSGAKAR